MPTVRCPICDRPFRLEENSSMPFCSDRCRLADLNRWLDEGYGLPIEPEDESPEDDFSDS